MTVLSAQTIRQKCYDNRMVWPFHERTVKSGKTFGLSAAGYDVRVEFEVGKVHRLHAAQFGGTAHRFTLASTMEHFIMPENVRGVVHDKSSWIRRGLTVGNTVIEPGWKGYLTLELIYQGDHEVFICAGDPIAQISFEFLDHYTVQPYTGKYQDQERGPQPAIEE